MLTSAPRSGARLGRGQDHHVIGEVHQRLAVGDHHDGPPARGQRGDGGADLRLTRPVEGGGGLVEQQDRRVGQQGSGDADAPGLPDRDAGPPSVIAVETRSGAPRGRARRRAGRRRRRRR